MGILRLSCRYCAKALDVKNLDVYCDDECKRQMDLKRDEWISKDLCHRCGSIPTDHELKNRASSGVIICVRCAKSFMKMQDNLSNFMRRCGL